MFTCYVAVDGAEMIVLEARRNNSEMKFIFGQILLEQWFLTFSSWTRTSFLGPPQKKTVVDPLSLLRMTVDLVPV